MTGEKKYLALDVGGSTIKYGVVHEDFTITGHGSVPTPHDAMENLLRAFKNIYAGLGAGTCGAGISFTATMDAATGYCFGGALEKYTGGANLRNTFQPVFPVPIAVENDGNCAALAEATCGNLRDCSDGIMLVLGTGVGGGLIHDHKILRGNRSCSGEFSYMITDYHSGKTFAEYNGTGGLTGPLSVIKNEPQMDGRRFFEYANGGDADALRILDDFTGHLAVQIFNMQAFYAPERFVIGGGISREPILMESLKRNLNVFYAAHTTLPRAEVMPGKYLDDSNLIGAVCYLRSVFNI